MNHTEIDTKRWLKIAYWLAVITIVYNIVEGIVSVFFGADDEALSLLGFGIDSFVEVISGIGILHMVRRMLNTRAEEYDHFERQALRITGTAFYLLAVGLVVGSLINIYNGNKPETTLPGIIISGISIISMFFLMKYKLKVGLVLGSEAIVSDAQCTRTCLYLSIILMVSSVIYQVFHFRYIDIAGSLGIAWFAYSEGKEAFEKMKFSKSLCRNTV
jgi:divalent metal cation (Fe/Co/Zn/Cd) transporter